MEGELGRFSQGAEVGEFAECSWLYAGNHIFFEVSARKRGVNINVSVRGVNINVSVSVNHRTRMISPESNSIDCVFSVPEQGSTSSHAITHLFIRGGRARQTVSQYTELDEPIEHSLCHGWQEVAEKIPAHQREPLSPHYAKAPLSHRT